MPSTPVSPRRTGLHGRPPSHWRFSRWREGLGEGTARLPRLSGPGMAPALPCRSQPCSPSTFSVCSRVSSPRLFRARHV